MLMPGLSRWHVSGAMNEKGWGGGAKGVANVTQECN